MRVIINISMTTYSIILMISMYCEKLEDFAY